MYPNQYTTLLQHVSKTYTTNCFKIPSIIVILICNDLYSATPDLLPIVINSNLIGLQFQTIYSLIALVIVSSLTLLVGLHVKCKRTKML